MFSDGAQKDEGDVMETRWDWLDQCSLYLLFCHITVS